MFHPTILDEKSNGSCSAAEWYRTIPGTATLAGWIRFASLGWRPVKRYSGHDDINMSRVAYTTALNRKTVIFIRVFRYIREEQMGDVGSMQQQDYICTAVRHSRGMLQLSPTASNPAFRHAVVLAHTQQLSSPPNNTQLHLSLT